MKVEWEARKRESWLWRGREREGAKEGNGLRLFSFLLSDFFNLSFSPLTLFLHSFFLAYIPFLSLYSFSTLFSISCWVCYRKKERREKRERRERRMMMTPQPAPSSSFPSFFLLFPLSFFFLGSFFLLPPSLHGTLKSGS